MVQIERERARIFRITHVRNIPWILEQGLRCQSSAIQDPNFRNIGSVDLIGKRNRRAVPIEPGGTLADYIPFYFTSRTPMLLNIKTGRGVELVPMREIAILVSSLPHLIASSVPFVFTDRHANLVTANFSRDLAQLGVIDWDILARSDFKRDDADLGKLERYQAEALVHKHCPIDGLTGIIAHDAQAKSEIEVLVTGSRQTVPVTARPDYYV